MKKESLERCESHKKNNKNASHGQRNTRKTLKRGEMNNEKYKKNLTT